MSEIVNMFRHDARAVERLERERYTYFDEALEVNTVKPWAYLEPNLVSFMDTYRRKGKCWVRKNKNGEIDGYMLYSAEEDHYRLFLLGGCEAARTELLQFVAKRAANHESRKEVRFTVPDDDYEQLRWLTEMGFKAKLKPNRNRKSDWNGGVDAWELTLTSRRPTRRRVAGEAP